MMIQIQEIKKNKLYTINDKKLVFIVKEKPLFSEYIESQEKIAFNNYYKSIKNTK